MARDLYSAVMTRDLDNLYSTQPWVNVPVRLYSSVASYGKPGSVGNSLPPARWGEMSPYIGLCVQPNVSKQLLCHCSRWQAHRVIIIAQTPKLFCDGCDGSYTVEQSRTRTKNTPTVFTRVGAGHRRLSRLKYKTVHGVPGKCFLLWPFEGLAHPACRMYKITFWKPTVKSLHNCPVAHLAALCRVFIPKSTTTTIHIKK